MNTPIPPGAAGDATAQTGAGRTLGLTPHLIRQFAGGAAIQGRVTATGGEGRLQIATPHGTLTLQTATSLPPGTPVSLQLTSQGPPAQLAVTPQGPGGAGGQGAGQAGQTLAARLAAPPPAPPAASPPAGPGAQPATAQSTAAGAPAQPAVLTSLTTGTVLQATVTGPPAGSTAAQGAGQGAAAGGQPSTSANAAPSGGGAASTAGAAPTSPAGLQAALAAGRALPTGTGLAVRLLAAAPPGQTLPAPGGPGGPGGGAVLSGTVTGQTAGGQTTLATTAGTLTLSTGGAPPTGTQMLLELAGAPRPPVPGASAPAGGGAPFGALADALALLGRAGAAGDAAPAAQQALQTLQSVLPQPTAQLGTSMLFVLQALRGGGLERLVGGERAQTIERLQRGLGERIEGDLRGAAAGRARDGAGGEWRALSLPLLSEGELERIRLYLRDRAPEDEETGAASGPRATRFILEASFSRLGPMQFDGLVRDKTLDLMIRSHRPLEADDRDAIRGLFADVVSALGYGGSVAFQVVRAFDILPVEETAGGPGGMTV